MYICKTFNKTSKLIHERVLNPDWIAFKSQYFSTALTTKGLFKEILLSTEEHSGSENYLKTVNASTEINFNGGSQDMVNLGARAKSRPTK